MNVSRRVAMTIAASALAMPAAVAQAPAGSAFNELAAKLYQDTRHSMEYAQLRLDAMSGKAAEQEMLADLIHQHGERLEPSQRRSGEGIHFLYRAAIGGRTTAMGKLSAALRAGTLGAARSPAAAACWSGAAAGARNVVDCVGLTQFSKAQYRPSCMELALASSELPADGGATMARVCAANKTPALLVPGLPPEREMRRAREFKKHGIELVFTGDVYRDGFERFRAAFNDTTVAVLDARHGSGYVDRLGARIEARLPKRIRRSATASGSVAHSATSSRGGWRHGIRPGKAAFIFLPPRQ